LYVQLAVKGERAKIELSSRPLIVAFVASSVEQPAGNPCATQASHDNASIKALAPYACSGQQKPGLSAGFSVSWGSRIRT
jgi:hypothetical protein